MVKVKIIRDDEQHNYEHYLGQIYDAFIDNFEEKNVYIEDLYENDLYE